MRVVFRPALPRRQSRTRNQRATNYIFIVSVAPETRRTPVFSRNFAFAPSKSSRLCQSVRRNVTKNLFCDIGKAQPHSVSIHETKNFAALGFDLSDLWIRSVRKTVTKKRGAHFCRSTSDNNLSHLRQLNTWQPRKVRGTLASYYYDISKPIFNMQSIVYTYTQPRLFFNSHRRHGTDKKY